MLSFSTHGELSERFKEPVLKTGDPERDLGFESLTLRHEKSTCESKCFFKRNKSLGLGYRQLVDELVGEVDFP